MESRGTDGRPQLPSPSLWPIGFAVGIVCILVGLIVSVAAVAVGVVLTLVFGFLWIRDVTGPERGMPVEETEPEPEPVVRSYGASAPLPANRGEAGMPLPEEGEVDRFPRSKFLEGATLGLGGVIGGIVTVPALGFAVLPAFVNQERDEVELGPIDEFPTDQFMVATFLLDADAGEVSRRTAFVRRNGDLEGRPSFTIVSNRCVHLGCPVQPNGLLLEEQKKTVETEVGPVELIPTRPAGFGCPCHGGAYDIEGNRTQGPPVRALDRYEFAIRQGRLYLGKTYSVSEVKGVGAEARIKKYRLAGPGEHVDGLESWLYPISPPQ